MALAMVARGVALVAVALLASAPGAGATTVLRQNGIGPLTLGMTRAAALHSGWLAHRSPGCELASPRPIAYTFTGPHAPAGLRGNAEFTSNRLTNISVSRGARTALGVTVGVTTPARMVSRYRAAGFRASSMFEPTFQATFVTVTRNHRHVIAGLADGPVLTLLAIPLVATCD